VRLLGRMAGQKHGDGNGKGAGNRLVTGVRGLCVSCAERLGARVPPPSILKGRARRAHGQAWNGRRRDKSVPPPDGDEGVPVPNLAPRFHLKRAIFAYPRHQPTNRLQGGGLKRVRARDRVQACWSTAHAASRGKGAMYNHAVLDQTSLFVPIRPLCRFC